MLELVASPPGPGGCMAMSCAAGGTGQARGWPVAGFDGMGMAKEEQRGLGAGGCRRWRPPASCHRPAPLHSGCVVCVCVYVGLTIIPPACCLQPRSRPMSCAARARASCSSRCAEQQRQQAGSGGQAAAGAALAAAARGAQVCRHPLQRQYQAFGQRMTSREGAAWAGEPARSRQWRPVSTRQSHDSHRC